MLDWMLDRGADITRTDDSRTAALGPKRMIGGGKDYSLKVLNRVAARGNVELFDHLVSRGADPSRSLALHCASECKDPVKTIVMIDHLLDTYHFDIEADSRQFLETGPRADHGTPLRCAVHHHNIDAVRHLLERGADSESALRFAAGGTIAIHRGWLPGLDALFDAGANVDRAFDHAVHCLKIDAAKACLDRGTVSAAVIKEHQIHFHPYSTIEPEYTEMKELLRSLGDC